MLKSIGLRIHTVILKGRLQVSRDSGDFQITSPYNNKLAHIQVNRPEDLPCRSEGEFRRLKGQYFDKLLDLTKINWPILRSIGPTQSFCEGDYLTT